MKDSQQQHDQYMQEHLRKGIVADQRKSVAYVKRLEEALEVIEGLADMVGDTHIGAHARQALKSRASN